MDLRRGHLLYFVTVAEERHFTRAAEKLHVTQPSLSQAIALLESDLGLQLLERRRTGVELTADGEIFLRKARTALSAWTQAFTPGPSAMQVTEGAIKFGFLGAPPGVDSPVALKRFSRAHPGIDLHYRELPFPSASTVGWLANVDVAACHRPPPHPDVWSQTLRSEPRVVLAPRGHRLAGRGELHVDEVLDETFIGLHPSVEPTWAGFWSLDDHRGSPPRLQTSDGVANPQEVVASLVMRSAITTVPASVARIISGAVPDIAAIPIHDADLAIITLVGHQDFRNPAVTALLDFARNDLAAIP
jgi:DNA-binding transcriptional LysR family regulator